jgi:hypothetical protein
MGQTDKWIELIIAFEILQKLPKISFVHRQDVSYIRNTKDVSYITFVIRTM